MSTELSGKVEKGFGLRDMFESFSNSVDSLYCAYRSLVVALEAN